MLNIEKERGNANIHASIPANILGPQRIASPLRKTLPSTYNTDNSLEKRNNKKGISKTPLQPRSNFNDLSPLKK